MTTRPGAMSLGCSFVVGLFGLIFTTGTVINNLPSLAAPVRLEMAARAAAAQPRSAAVAPLIAPTASALPPADSSAPAPAPASLGPYPNPWAAAIPQAACIPTDLPQTGKVVQVIDAATIRVLLDSDQRVYAVRYLGLDLPPALDYRLAQQGTLHNLDLVYDQPVTLVRDVTDQDEYGRLLRYVMVGRTFVNYDVIASGFARSRSSEPDAACSSTFDSAQQQAQSFSLGLWSPPSPGS